MALYTIELDAATDGKLRSVAARRDVSPEELCGVAIRNLLDAAPLEEPELGEDAYTALWEFVPAKGGPDDSSIHHDVRPGDPL